MYATLPVTPSRKMRRRTKAWLAAGIAAVGAALAVPAAAEDTETPVLQPSSAWHLDMAADKCRLAQRFGEGDNEHIVFIEQAQPSEQFDMTVAGPSFKKMRSSRDVVITFDGLEDMSETRYFVGDVEGYGDAVIMSSLSSDAQEGTSDESNTYAVDGLPTLNHERFADVSHVRVGQGFRGVTFAIPGIGAAFEAMNACTADLVSFWGLDADAHKTMTRRVQWLNIEESSRYLFKRYPRAAVLRGEQGIFRMRVIVDEDGRATECHLNSATTQEHLKSPGCDLMDRIRFAPALDAAGSPMRSYFLMVIHYVMP